MKTPDLPNLEINGGASQEADGDVLPGSMIVID